LSIPWFDENTHPRSPVAFCHRHHDVTRLAVDLCPFVLRREGKVELIDEGSDHNLHLEGSANSSVTGFCLAQCTKKAFGDGTHANRQPTHARVPLAMPSGYRVRKVYGVGICPFNTYRSSSCGTLLGSVPSHNDKGNIILTRCQTCRC
jgi:hypothetical protein